MPSANRLWVLRPHMTVRPRRRRVGELYSDAIIDAIVNRITRDGYSVVSIRELFPAPCIAGHPGSFGDAHGMLTLDEYNVPFCELAFEPYYPRDRNYYHGNGTCGHITWPYCSCLLEARI